MKRILYTIFCIWFVKIDTNAVELPEPFVPAPWVLWLNTDYKVDVGVLPIRLQYVYTDYCKVLLDEKEKRQPVAQIVFERLHSRCKESHDRHFTPALQRVDESIKINSKRKLRRIKRCVEPISFVLCTGVAVTLIGGGTAAGLYFGHPDSPHHTVPALQKVVAELSYNLTLTQNATIGQQTVLGDIHKTLAKMAASNERMTFENNMVTLATVDAAWAGSEIQHLIVSHAENIYNIAEGYIKNKVPLKDVARLLGVKRLGEFDESDSRFVDMVHDNESVSFDIKIRLNAEDTFIYEADPFEVWVNLTEAPELLIYDGPKFVLHNSTSNCTKGIKQLKGRISYERCDETDYSDPRLQLWNKAQDMNFTLNEKRIIVKKLSDKAYVSCMFQNITLGNLNVRCPNFPFVLDIHQSFNVTGHVHTVEALDDQRTNRFASFTFKTLNNSLTFDMRNQDVLELIAKIGKKNNEIDTLLNEKISVLGIPIQGTTLWIIGVAVILFWVVSIVCAVCLFKFNGNFSGGALPAPAFHVTNCNLIGAPQPNPNPGNIYPSLRPDNPIVHPISEPTLEA